MLWGRVACWQPDFKTGAVIGGEITSLQLSSYKGKWVVLFYYPKGASGLLPRARSGRAVDLLPVVGTVWPKYRVAFARADPHPLRVSVRPHRQLPPPPHPLQLADFTYVCPTGTLACVCVGFFPPFQGPGTRPCTKLSSPPCRLRLCCVRLERPTLDPSPPPSPALIRRDHRVQ